MCVYCINYIHTYTYTQNWEHAVYEYAILCLAFFAERTWLYGLYNILSAIVPFPMSFVYFCYFICLPQISEHKPLYLIISWGNIPKQWYYWVYNKILMFIIHTEKLRFRKIILNSIPTSSIYGYMFTCNNRLFILSNMKRIKWYLALMLIFFSFTKQ